MRDRSNTRPTDSELAILRVLWDRGPSTVREVHDALQGTQDTGYTTVLKLMQIMAEKDLVRRDESARAHVYEPTRTQAETQTHLLRDLVDRAFGGSPSRLVLRALSDDRASEQELDEIRRLLGELPEKES